AGSARPGRPLRLAFGERHGWITPLAALPLVPAFAILVCVPLALRAVGPGDSTGRLSIATYPIAAAAATLALLLPSGIPPPQVAASGRSTWVRPRSSSSGQRWSRWA